MRLSILIVLSSLLLLISSCKGVFDTSDTICIVESDELNIREKASDNSKVVGRAVKNDKLIFVNTKGNWTFVKKDSLTEGFVFSKLVTILSTPQTGFDRYKLRFIKIFKNVFLMLLIVLGLFDQIKNRRKDARYSKGYRELKINIVYLAFKSAIIASLIAGLGGFFSV